MFFLLKHVLTEQLQHGPTKCQVQGKILNVLKTGNSALGPQTNKQTENHQPPNQKPKQKNNAQRKIATIHKVRLS